MVGKKWSVILVVVIALVLGLWTAPTAWMQEAVTLTIKEIDVETGFPRINATVTVVNPSGVPIAELAQSDFEVMEDREPLTIEQVTSQSNPDRAIAVCLVLDLSGSAPLDQVKVAANQFLDTLGPDDRVALIGFNVPLDFNVPDPTKEVEFTTDKDMIRTVVDELVSVGESAVYEAIYKGVLWTAQETAERRAVLVMTDGYDTISRPEIATADTPKAAARDKHIPIFTIGVYSPDFASKPDYLRVLADETGGEYHEADPAQIASRFEEVGDLLRLEYQLAFNSRLAPLEQEEHVLTIRAITPSGEGEIQRTATYPPPKRPVIVELQRGVSGALQTLEAGQEVRGKALLVPRIAARNPIAKVEYYVDEQLLYTAMTDAVANYTHKSWEWSWNSRIAGEGDHTLEIVAYDDAGNASDRFSLNVTVKQPSIITVIKTNLWLVAAIVAVVVLLAVVLFFILRRPTPVPAPAGPASAEGLPTWTAPPAEPPTTPSAPATPSGERVPTAFVGERPLVAAPPSPKTERLRREPEAMGWLIVEKGPHEGREFRLQEVTAIGRGGDNDVIIDDPAVSRQHAKVKLEDQTFVIYDLGATNTTEVNGQEIGKRQLMDGDRVKIGETVMVFKQVEQAQE